ncbi:MAG: flavodoxin family protein [Firmicutes bacterium]|nr:flavodoxin family protein [Bacillota bacterium]
MGKKIIAVNAGPRKGWNTDTLIDEAVRGAESAGAEIQKFDLFKLEKYTGCISCFGCKKEKFKGHCICRDGLTPVLDAIREADGLIIGSPNYLGELKDYSKTDWPWYFDAEAKYRRHETVFPQECKKVYSMGAELATKTVKED